MELRISSKLKEYEEKGVYITMKGNDKKSVYERSRGNKGISSSNVEKLMNEIKEYKWIVPRQTMNKVIDSYGMKHRMEQVLGEYVSNGDMIMALLLLGYSGDFDGRLNIFFNISRKSGIVKHGEILGRHLYRKRYECYMELLVLEKLWVVVPKVKKKLKRLRKDVEMIPFELTYVMNQVSKDRYLYALYIKDLIKRTELVTSGLREIKKYEEVLYMQSFELLYDLNRMVRNEEKRWVKEVSKVLNEKLPIELVEMIMKRI